MLLTCISSEDYLSYISNVSPELIMFAFGGFWLLLIRNWWGVEEEFLLCF